jgi:hypothetical protein
MFTVINNSSLNCFDEHIFISFELIDFREENKNIPAQAFLTQNGFCLAEKQHNSKVCKRIRR